MLLISLKQYVKDKGLVSMSELTTCFSIDPDVISDMLNFLIQKGCVRLRNKTAGCGIKCVKCPASATQIVEWVGGGASH